MEDGKLYASAAGYLTRVNRLLTVTPLRQVYQGPDSMQESLSTLQRGNDLTHITAGVFPDRRHRGHGCREGEASSVEPMESRCQRKDGRRVKAVQYPTTGRGTGRPTYDIYACIHT